MISRIQKPLQVLCVLLLVLSLAGCEQREQSDSHGKASPRHHYAGTIIAVGDSLTAGLGVAEEEAYPARLERMLAENGYDWQVVNAGVSGETSSGALARIRWIISRHPEIVILATGGNDGLRGIDTDVVYHNIDQTVVLLKEADIEVVLAGMEMVRNMGLEYTKAFAAIYPTVARKHLIISIPFLLTGVAAVPSLNQADGIHPTARGHEIVAETVYPYVVQAIKARMATGEPVASGG